MPYQKRKTEKINMIGRLKEAALIALLVTMLLTLIMFIL